jgi:predicted nucleotide-binding protein
MKERFEGANRHNLIDALKRQEFVGGDGAIAEQMAAKGELVEFQKLDKLIVEDAEDNDIYLLLAGSVSIVIKGNEYRSRHAGQHVGEMAAIEPTLKRSATVVANETVVALKLASATFMAIGNTFPQIWLPMARELSRRLHQRNSMILPPNEFPKLFIISSSEALPVATELRGQLEHAVFSTVWSEGVFFAGGYPLDALEKAVAESDFAVAIAQADDVVRSRKKMQRTLRDNVLF